MRKPETREQKDRTRIANLIEKNGSLYLTDKEWRFMVDNTIFFTPEEQRASMAIIGGTLQKKGYDKNS